MTATETDRQTVLKHGSLELDLIDRVARVKGKTFKVTPVEFFVLKRFMELYAHGYANYDAFCEYMQAQGMDWSRLHDSNVLAVYVNRLRNKLGRDLIESRVGFGYRLKAAG